MAAGSAGSGKKRLIDYAVANAQFAAALGLARGSGALPPEWVERTTKIGDSPNKTFIAVLGTSLLARATNDHVNPRALMVGGVTRGYSARSLASKVLIPLTTREDIDLESGPEPFNNNPFNNEKEITAALTHTVKKKAQPAFEHLLECLDEVDFLRGDDALRAFAAFLRVRIGASSSRVKILVGSTTTMSSLLLALEQFMKGDAEDGKVGQAVVAAILDVVFDDVRTPQRVYDPSRRWPGDVGVFVADHQVLGVEVKQRPFSEHEVLRLAKRLQLAGIRRGRIVALCEKGLPFDVGMARSKASAKHNVELSFDVSAVELLETAVRWSAKDLSETLSTFPSRLMSRMDEIGVSPERRRSWASLVEPG